MNRQKTRFKTCPNAGGHHIVFNTMSDKIDNEMYMAIDRVPLVSEKSNEKSNIYKHSRNSAISHGNKGWRSNLKSDMVFENRAQSNVTRLYPTSKTTTYNSIWSCPLRRIGFWTKNKNTKFSPLVPSPTRNARLFRDMGQAGTGTGTGMTYGTRSHPTQKFEYLEELATVITSNGFCFCKDIGDCRKDIASDATCSFKDTLKSLWDGKYRATESLFKNDKVCTSQLDWPFVKAVMRDGMEKKSTNTQTECNVVDRLPKFKYKFVIMHYLPNP